MANDPLIDAYVERNFPASTYASVEVIVSVVIRIEMVVFYHVSTLISLVRFEKLTI